MKRNGIVAIGILSVCLFVAGCGNSENETQETAQTEILQNTELSSSTMTELEIQIEEFKQNTPSEITVINDLLRGTWRLGNYDDFIGESYNLDVPILGEFRVEYDINSPNSNITFTDNEFTVNYETVELSAETGTTCLDFLKVSGLYRVTAGETYDDEIESCDS